MRCFYEVLGVERDADDNTIKTAYRKAALSWHPDKNLHRVEEATERFQEIREAFDVLSDPRERAWYDKNRGSFLRTNRGGYGGGRSASTQEADNVSDDDDIDLFPYFSTKCFSGYGDGANGFYGVYERVFKEIWEAEVLACKQASKEAPAQPPSFGTAEMVYTEVEAFYKFWTSFQTVKEMRHAEAYPSSCAPNRWARKKFSAENAKRRNAARKEFNENVRELAKFVKRRDKRVAAYKAQQAQLRAEKEQAELLRRQKEAAEKAERARAFRVAAWAQQEQEEESADEEEEFVDQLYCPACDKVFRSEGAYANHERSKKHLENVKALRAALAQEEAAAGSGGGSRETTGQEGAAGPLREGGPSSGTRNGPETHNGRDAAAARPDSGAAASAVTGPSGQDSGPGHVGLRGKSRGGGGGGQPDVRPTRRDGGTGPLEEARRKADGGASPSLGGRAPQEARTLAGGKSRRPGAGPREGRGGEEGAEEDEGKGEDEEEESEGEDEDEEEEGEGEDEDAFLQRMMKLQTGRTHVDDEDEEEEEEEEEEEKKGGGVEGREGDATCRGGLSRRGGGGEEPVVPVSDYSDKDLEEEEEEDPGEEFGEDDLLQRLINSQQARARGVRESDEEDEEEGDEEAGAETREDGWPERQDTDDGTRTRDGDEGPGEGQGSASVPGTRISEPASHEADGGGSSADHGGEDGGAEAKGKGRRRGKKGGKEAQATSAAGNSGQAAAPHAKGAGGRGAAAAPRTAKAGRKAAAATGAGAGGAENATVCGVCGLDCRTRNRLFKHLAATGHAVFRA
eukprot:jgi/Botrbrau1/13056/Bobra.0187s0018.1